MVWDMGVMRVRDDMISYLAVAEHTVLASSCNRYFLVNGKDSLLFYI